MKHFTNPTVLKGILPKVNSEIIVIHSLGMKQLC